MNSPIAGWLKKSIRVILLKERTIQDLKKKLTVVMTISKEGQGENFIEEQY